jgi:quercetin dioxygenase-like cupin family protein
MADTTVKKVDSEFSPEGTMGQTYLAGGKRVAMRMWEEEPGDAQDKSAHTRPYETVGYVIEGRAELELEDQTIILKAGDSWVVPENAAHTYTILEPFKAVEATAPPARHQ